MTQGLDALTEKEKQTLRLIVSGYDAKSLARHLGLSVHTVNERLREARRKLSVSSSREAARLLREAEARTPELFADKALGEDPGATGAQPVMPAGGGAMPPWRLPLIGGLTIMSLLLAAFALATQAGPATAPATTAEAPATANQAAATDAARAFLALVDARDWSRSYAATGRSFHEANTETLWAESSEKVYPPLGTVRSRTLAYADFVPASPNGSWIIKFRSSFANRASVVETVALVREDGGYKVTGIFVE